MIRHVLHYIHYIYIYVLNFFIHIHCNLIFFQCFILCNRRLTRLHVYFIFEEKKK